MPTKYPPRNLFLDKLFIGTAITAASIGLALKLGGSGQVIDNLGQFKTTYHGLDAVIVREVKKLEFDSHYLLINNQDRITGEIIDDFNRKITVSSSGYSVTDPE